MTLILSGTNGLSDVDGDASTPAIRGTDANTGMFFGTDIVGLSTGGSERMRITSAGNVGIGTTSPATNLNVYNASSAIISVEADSTSQFRATRYSNDVAGPGLFIRKARGTLASPSAVNSADQGGVINFQVYGGTNFRNVAQVIGACETFTSDTNVAGTLFFLTNAGGTTLTERMRITAAGNVGIGTTSPAYVFDITGSGGSISTARVRNGSTGGSDGSQLLLGNSANFTNAYFRLNGGGNTSQAGAGSLNIGLVESQPMAFYTANTERMRIDASGNVNIATGRLRVAAGADEGTQLNLWTTGGGDAGIAAFQTLFYTGANNARTERMRIDSSGGLILAGSTAQKATGTTWSNPSDQRLKDNIRDYTKGISELMKIRVREWEYNGKGGTVNGTKGLGVVADEIVDVLPDTVKTYEAKLNADDEETTAIKKFDATEITWLLVNAVKELSAQLDESNLTLTSVKAKNDALEARIAALEGAQA